MAGNDLELAHSEARTAAVSLSQFHAANTIYNIDSTCNILELYVQFSNQDGVLQEGKSVIVTIPIGYYNLTNLLSVLNSYIYLAFDPNYNSTGVSTLRPTTAGGDSYFPGFGDPYTDNNQTPAIAIDNHETSQLKGFAKNGASNFTSHIIDSTFYKTYKIKLFTPPLASLTHVTKTWNRCYDGYYIITSNYPGLAKKLGFPNSRASFLPSLKISNVPEPRGFGITLSRSSGGSNIYYSIAYTSPNILSDKTQFVSNYLKGSFRETGALLGYTWIDLDSPRSIYVTIDSIITRNRSSNPKLPFGSIFARIPTGSTTGAATGFGEIILYEPYISHEVYVPGLNLDQITIRLFDEYGLPIQWNGGHWSMTLSVKHSIDVGSAGIEDSTLGRTYRPYLHGTDHDALQTQHEFHHKKSRRGL